MNTSQDLQRAASYHQSGRLDEAAELYQQVLQREPDHPDALHLLGVLSLQRGDAARGIALITRAVARRPQVAAYRLSLATALLENGRAAEALEHSQHAAIIQPQSAEAHTRAGQACALLGRWEEAAAAFERATAVNPGFSPAHALLGVIHFQRGRPREAAKAYRAALAIDPDDAETLNKLAHALAEMGDRAGSLEAFESAARSAAAQAHFASAPLLNDYGAALLAAGRIDEAATVLEQAARIDPNAGEIRSNLANALKSQGRPREAIEQFRLAIRLDPTSAPAHSNLLFALHFDPATTPAAIAQEHRAWAARHATAFESATAATSHPPHANLREPDRRLRIGYVSPDFRDHPVGRFALPVLELHDSSAWEIYCYSSAPAVSGEDAITQRFRQTASQWRDVALLSDEQLAHQIREDRIDVLVDLAGHTAHNRLLAFARRPAPVQVTWLGYPNTTGLRTIRARLTDALADPPGMTESFHSEALLVRLPRCAWCFQPPDDSPEPARIASATTAGGDRGGDRGRDSGGDRGGAGGVTFGSFNSLSKLNDDLLRLWAKVLQATPGSRLLIKAAGRMGEQSRRRVLEVFRAAGVSSERIELLDPAESHAAHLAAYARVDVALDAYPYHGTTTTCEALWMGVPVVTLAGSTHVSRVGVSLLTNVGLPQLIAPDAEPYVQIASRLAGDAAQIDALRRDLRAQMLASPLMDVNRFVRDFEQAIRELWQTWCTRGSAESP